MNYFKLLNFGINSINRVADCGCDPIDASLCSSQNPDCDAHGGQGCGCGASDNHGGGCDRLTAGAVTFSCDQDICNNDLCTPNHITPVVNTDLGCRTEDRCSIDWSNCSFGSDFCNYDNPCGCNDTNGQPGFITQMDNI